MTYKIEDFERKLKNYAKIIIEKGINAGKRPLIIRTSVDCKEFARLLVKYAYENGTSEVIMEWRDDDITKMYYENASDDALVDYPDFLVEKQKYYFEKGAGVISVIGDDPELLKNIDQDRLKARNEIAMKKTKPIRKYTMNDLNTWCVVAAPTKGWASKVFPDMDEDDAVNKLWDEIFKATRADQEDPIKAWDDHVKNMDKHADYLNEKQFVSLHYTNSLGTDLEVELPKNHIWLSAGSTDSYGNIFIANIPTEEVFTLPKKTGVNGVVYSSKPLNYNGNTIKGMKFKFENGRVVDFSAEEGEETLKNMFEIDENGRYLGEVALVPYDSPISKSNITFITTLFDENASCHLAFGQAYPTCIEGGVDMSEKELEENGVNDALIHEDFMVGTEDLNIVAEDEEGNEVQIFKDGNWAF